MKPKGVPLLVSMILSAVLIVCLSTRQAVGEVPDWVKPHWANDDTEFNQPAERDPSTKDTVIQKLGPSRPGQTLPVNVHGFHSPYAAAKTGRPPLQPLNRLFEPNHWTAQGIPGAKKLPGQCWSALKMFVSALANHTTWAAQMSDASGRYGSEFLFGNQFWLGSKLLCEVLRAPFPASFHAAKLRLQLDRNLVPMGVREVTLGVCLPASCSSKDVFSILEDSVSAALADEVGQTNGLSIDIANVRPLPGPYSLIGDHKFHVIMIVLALTITLMILGTTYEIMLERRSTRIKSSNNNHEANVKLALRITFQKLDKQQTSQQQQQQIDDDHCYNSVGLLRRAILCFSVLTNGKKILNCSDTPSESLSCIHGLRFYSLAWVIMAHTYLQIFVVAGNKGRKWIAEKNFLFQTVSNATFSVDTFFFISGLLGAYVFLSKLASPRRSGASSLNRPFGKDMKTMAGKFFSLIGYRFIRLTPAYLFVLICSELAMKWIKNMSVFEPTSDDDITCPKYWWRNILYINSLFPRSEMCMLWSWYLANDTQFYIIGVFFLLLSARYFKTSVASLGLLLISSSVTCAIIAVKYGYLVRVEDRFMLFDELYDKPWTRLGPYIVGILTGWILSNPKLKISKKGSFCGWTLSILAMSILVYGVRDAELSVAGSAAYVALGHIIWGAALSWIVVASTTGHGGYVNKMLSCPLLFPLGRLTYCAYLVHPVIMRLTSFQMDGSLHLSSILSVILFFGNIVAAFFISFFISLMFEAPIIRLLKVLMPQPTSRPTTPPSD